MNLYNSKSIKVELDMLKDRMIIKCLHLSKDNNINFIVNNAALLENNTDDHLVVQTQEWLERSITLAPFNAPNQPIFGSVRIDFNGRELCKFHWKQLNNSCFIMPPPPKKSTSKVLAPKANESKKSLFNFFCGGFCTLSLFDGFVTKNAKDDGTFDIRVICSSDVDLDEYNWAARNCIFLSPLEVSEEGEMILNKTIQIAPCKTDGELWLDSDVESLEPDDESNIMLSWQYQDGFILVDDQQEMQAVYDGTWDEILDDELIDIIEQNIIELKTQLKYWQDIDRESFAKEMRAAENVGALDTIDDLDNMPIEEYRKKIEEDLSSNENEPLSAELIKLADEEANAEIKDISDRLTLAEATIAKYKASQRTKFEDVESDESDESEK